LSKKFGLVFVMALFLIFSAACALAAGTDITVIDMFERKVTLSQPATRIVALTASDCEILCALGAEETLVGRGSYCDYPESILDVPVVDSGSSTNIEQIIALAPQVVLMSDMAQSVEQVEALERAGIKVVVSNANTIDEVYKAIRMIGSLMGKTSEAENLVLDMQKTFEDISNSSKNKGKTVYFEVSPLQWGLWTAGNNTFMNELANICGLKNAFEDINGWAEISEEQVLARNPDYIVTITMYYGQGPTPVEEIMSRSGWNDIEAVKNGNVLNADSNEISRPGPRLKDAALSMYKFLSEKEVVLPAA